MYQDPTPLRRHGEAPSTPTAEDLIVWVARGDESAFSALYDLLSPYVFGLVRRVLRNPAHAEEVSQEVFVELWRQATRFDPTRGTVRSWVLTLAHRRAVDRVRAEQAAADRERRAAAGNASPPYDEVVEEVAATLEQEQVRRCLGTLTELQREAVTLAYYRGYNYREVAELLGANLATIKTRMRDGLIRLRDCLGLDTGVTR
jgi:RNA polymerase sigma-70 factor, ECF subfamily